jgi:hypothetical protein
MSPHRVGMDVEKRGGAPQGQEILLRPRLALAGGIGHGGHAANLRQTGTTAERTLGGDILPVGRISTVRDHRAPRPQPPLLCPAPRADPNLSEFLDVMFPQTR